MQGFDTIGVRCFNVFDGVTYPGRLATLDVATGEVNNSSPETTVSILPSEGDAETSEYFNLSGLRVASPTQGIFLKKITLTDGSVKTVKEIVR